MLTLRVDIIRKRFGIENERNLVGSLKPKSRKDFAHDYRSPKSQNLPTIKTAASLYLWARV